MDAIAIPVHFTSATDMILWKKWRRIYTPINCKSTSRVYCNKVSPQKTPLVVGKLLDLDANEDFVRGLLNPWDMRVRVEELVEQVERRNRLRLLQPWLEARI